MEREVTHRCGHVRRHQLPGLFAADRDAAAHRLARRRCDACGRDRAEAAPPAPAEAALPALVGSERQVSWAAGIRRGQLAALRRDAPAAVPRFAAIVEARWWIDHRAAPLATLAPRQ